MSTNLQLKHFADEYEQAQRRRIALGNQVASVALGRDPDKTLDVSKTPKGEYEYTDTNGELVQFIEARVLLKVILAGRREGPEAIPALTAAFRQYHGIEREAAKGMAGVIGDHPAWHWLEQVRGIGPTLACKLLARLDIRIARTPSAFWAYCGLATVPGNKYRCSECGKERAYPVRYKVTGEHKALNTKRDCNTKMVLVAGPDDGVRCAQPRPASGEKAAYDQYAKKVCFLIGMQFVKIPGCAYEEIYRAERAKLDRDRPGWEDGRKHYTALRKTEKLFLSHLWQIWREAESLPVVEHYAHAQLGHSTRIDPWEMVEGADAPE